MPPKKKVASKATTKRTKSKKTPEASCLSEKARKVLEEEISAIRKKVEAGKRITVAERNQLHQFASSDEEALADSLASPATVPSIAALCGVLGISRDTFYKWRKKFPKEIPQNQTNGQYDVAAWRAFAKKNNLKGGDEDETSEEDKETLEELKKEDLRIKIEERNFKLAILRQDFIAREDVREEISKLVAGAIKLLRDRFENELPPVCAGLDAVRIRKENANAIDEVCRLLQEGGDAMGEPVLEGDEEE